MDFGLGVSINNPVYIKTKRVATNIIEATINIYFLKKEKHFTIIKEKQCNDT